MNPFERSSWCDANKAIESNPSYSNGIRFYFYRFEVWKISSQNDVVLEFFMWAAHTSCWMSNSDTSSPSLLQNIKYYISDQKCTSCITNVRNCLRFRGDSWEASCLLSSNNQIDLNKTLKEKKYDFSKFILLFIKTLDEKWEMRNKAKGSSFKFGFLWFIKIINSTRSCDFTAWSILDYLFLFRSISIMGLEA